MAIIESTEHFDSIQQQGSYVDDDYCPTNFRVAVCLSGQLRTALVTAPAIFHFFRDSLNEIDFFIHTWDVEGSSPHDLNSRPRKPEQVLNLVPAEKLKSVLDIYKPVYYRVDNYSAYQLQYIDCISKKNGVCYSNIGMFQSLWESNNLKKKLEKKTKIPYWLVIRMRFDQVFRKENSWEQEKMYMAEKTNFLYVCDRYNKLPEAIEDIAWYGNSSTMDTVCDFAIHRSVINNNHIDWQTGHMLYCTENGIAVKSWKDNTMILYRDYHHNVGISPFDIKN